MSSAAGKTGARTHKRPAHSTSHTAGNLTVPLALKLLRMAWNWIASRSFFVVCLAIFTLQAMLLAVSAAFSMAFDEFVHVGIIDLYAQHWLPFSITQPSGPAVYSSVTTDGSFLFHYLMSFPYRALTAVFPHSFQSQIIGLRLIDIGFFIAGLVVFWHVLKLAGLRQRTANLLMAFVMLLPVSVLLAAQVNYDTLLFLCSGMVFWAAWKVLYAIQTNKQLPLRTSLVLLGLLAWTVCVKYVFLPVALGVFVYVGFQAVQLMRKNPSVRRGLKLQLPGLHSVKGLLAVTALLSGLFFGLGRYGANLVHYHSILPECPVVLDTETCRGYEPFDRDQTHKELGYHLDISGLDKLQYPFYWFNQITYESFFAVGTHELGYPTGKPIKPAYYIGYGLAIITSLAIVLRLPSLWRAGSQVRLWLICTALYIGALFVKNYHNYVSTGVPVAIHGRYLFPVLLLLAALAYLAIRPLLMYLPRYSRAALTTLCLSGLVLGGGILPYIMRSSDAWFFPNSQYFINKTRSILWPYFGED